MFILSFIDFLRKFFKSDLPWVCNETVVQIKKNDFIVWNFKFAFTYFFWIFTFNQFLTSVNTVFFIIIILCFTCWTYLVICYFNTKILIQTLSLWITSTSKNNIMDYFYNYLPFLLLQYRQNILLHLIFQYDYNLGKI